MNATGSLGHGSESDFKLTVTFDAAHEVPSPLLLPADPDPVYHTILDVKSSIIGGRAAMELYVWPV